MLRGGGAASRSTAIPEVDRHPRPSDKGLFAPSPAEGEAAQKGRPRQSTCWSRLTSRSRSFTAPPPVSRGGSLDMMLNQVFCHLVSFGKFDG